MHYLWLFTHNLAPADQELCVGLNHTFHPVQVDLCWEVQPQGGYCCSDTPHWLCSINHNLSSVNW